MWIFRILVCNNIYDDFSYSLFPVSLASFSLDSKDLASLWYWDLNSKACQILYPRWLPENRPGVGRWVVREEALLGVWGWRGKMRQRKRGGSWWLQGNMGDGMVQAAFRKGGLEIWGQSSPLVWPFLKAMFFSLWGPRIPSLFVIKFWSVMIWPWMKKTCIPKIRMHEGEWLTWEEARRSNSCFLEDSLSLSLIVLPRNLKGMGRVFWEIGLQGWVGIAISTTHHHHMLHPCLSCWTHCQVADLFPQASSSFCPQGSYFAFPGGEVTTMEARRRAPYKHRGHTLHLVLISKQIGYRFMSLWPLQVDAHGLPLKIRFLHHPYFQSLNHFCWSDVKNRNQPTSGSRLHLPFGS